METLQWTQINVLFPDSSMRRDEEMIFSEDMKGFWWLK